MEKEIKEKLCEQIEEKIQQISEEGINQTNVVMLGDLVDIHKDLANEDYWDKKKEGIDMKYKTSYMPYGEYDERKYGARTRDSRGRYMGRGRGRGYHGEEMLEEMMDNYGTYMEGGNYAGETDKAFDYMLQSAEDFMNHLMEESENPEQMEKIRRMAKRISEMR